MGEEPSLAAECSGPSVTLLHQRRCVDRLALYVDEHLTHPLTLDELAPIAGMSKFHLHRTVTSLTGETPAQLVHVSRLRAAMIRLSGAPSTLRVLDVALEVGFQDASAFSRSFRLHFGLTPTQVLAGAVPAPRWTLPASSTRAPSSGTDASIAQTVHISSFFCYGHEAMGEHARTFAQQAPQAFSSAFDVVERHGIEESLGPMAVPSGTPWVESSKLRLLCAFRSAVRLSLPSLTERSVAGGRYLVARHVGPYESRWQTWSRLSVWRRSLLDHAAHQPDNRTPFELERAVGGSGQPAADIYFPI